jgi:hypothetical protein
MDELLVAEVLDHLDRGLEAGRVRLPVELDVLGPEAGEPVVSEAPRPSTKAAGTRFIEGEPMKRATKTFTGCV